MLIREISHITTYFVCTSQFKYTLTGHDVSVTFHIFLVLVGGAWLVAHTAEQRRRFKAVLCTKPARTFSKIREERKRAEKVGRNIVASTQIGSSDEEEEEKILDGFFLVIIIQLNDKISYYVGHKLFFIYSVKITENEYFKMCYIAKRNILIFDRSPGGINGIICGISCTNNE